MISATAFIADMIQERALKFGGFTLKSGLKSPYFFNLGSIASAEGLNKIGFALAQRIHDLNLNPEVIFGPAYKGITLATVTSLNLLNFGMSVSIAYDRKEVKSHGEGGQLIGCNLESKRVLIIDDVFTNGASKVHAQEVICAHGGVPIGVLVAFDRQERDPASGRSFLEVVEERLQLGIYSVASLQHLLAYLAMHEDLKATEQRLRDYAANSCAIQG